MGMAEAMGEASAGLEELIEDTIDYTDQLNTVISYAGAYDQSVRDITDAETALADLREARPWDKQAIADAEQAIKDLQAAEEQRTQQFIADQILMILATDGLTEAENQVYLDYLETSGLMSDEARRAADAAIAEAVRQAAGITAALNGIPDQTVYIQYVYDYPGGDVPDPSEGMAGGGSVKPGGWAMVGDAPGGGKTPFTEYIHARPGGGVDVFNQAQMSGKSAPPMSTGGSLPAAGEVELSYISIQRLAQAIGREIGVLNG
jgi:hypothetical protein